MSIDQRTDERFVRQAAPQAVVLARQLVEGVGNHQMRRATLVLAFFRDGYWLRRFVEEPELGAVVPRDRPASVNWAGVRELLRTPELLDDGRREPGTMGPHLAVLELAASLAAGHPIDLCRAATQLSGAEWRDALLRMESAADFV
ncbi:hypothetical protein GT045_14430 [Streptomyces sp. SID486]|uniref:hypothetical protein n=1 Tax=unclassified Streptomyces TaxID=2593676 RepID=UPI0013708949|nr:MULTISPECIES: hypothetical protein [unclassified Streptomyces]MYW20404.1 hypothetical protein [Streptomyces sp. SID2955]MYW45096.1 hypothetical protein [Streptomyces sp. SID161]MYX95979.1 hypothetical protein [Streptomyces sp. SID486]